MTKWIARAMGMALLLPLALSGATLWLEPLDGHLEGQAGTTVGWGYQIKNDNANTEYYLVVTAVSFSYSTFLSGESFTDLISATFAPLGSGDTTPAALTAWDPGYPTVGLASFHIGPSRVMGEQIGGGLLDADPSYINVDYYYVDASGEWAAEGGAVQANAWITVNADAEAIPEPATVLLFGGALGLLALAWRRRAA